MDNQNINIQITLLRGWTPSNDKDCENPMVHKGLWKTTEADEKKFGTYSSVLPWDKELKYAWELWEELRASYDISQIEFHKKDRTYHLYFSNESKKQPSYYTEDIIIVSGTSFKQVACKAWVTWKNGGEKHGEA